MAGAPPVFRETFQFSKESGPVVHPMVSAPVYDGVGKTGVFR